ncbi:MAG TPA: ABC transporter substrate-binding protein [Pyrinomonadaceae bacterium]
MKNGLLRGLVLTLLFTSALQAQEPIRVGTIVHRNGPLAASGQQSEAALKAYFDEVNSLGGVNGRKIDLVVASVETADVQRVIDQNVIAFVGGVIAGHEKPINELIRTSHVPLIGPATLVPPVDLPLNPYGFYLMPGIKEQASALVNFAVTKPELKNAPAAIVYFEGELNTAGAGAVEGQATSVGWKGVTKSVQSNDVIAVNLVQEFKLKRTQTVFFFGKPEQLKQLMQACEAANITPTFLTIGAIAGADLSATVTPAFKDKFFLTFPSVPTDVTAADELRSMRDKYKLAATHPAMQFATLAAARVFVMALTRSGNAPTRPGLVTSLEQLKDYETGYSPRITFSKTRRVGAPGAYIITYDPATKNLVPLGWTSAY